VLNAVVVNVSAEQDVDTKTNKMIDMLTNASPYVDTYSPQWMKWGKSIVGFTNISEISIIGSPSFYEHA
jgi:hypothetical protein